jgi:hypothetical protein
MTYSGVSRVVLPVPERRQPTPAAATDAEDKQAEGEADRCTVNPR